MVKPWSHDPIRLLLSETTCPRCGFDPLSGGICSNCQTDLRGDPGVELWAATQSAATVLTQRDLLVEKLPTLVRGPAPAATTPTVVAAPVARPVPVAAAPVRESQVSVQSVLAVAGAGLFAIAALVFTFSSPDLSIGIRTLILAVITVLFLAGAWLLARIRLQFSAEAIGALGMVFLALDIWGVTQLADGRINGWVSVGIGTLVAAVLTLVIGVAARIRTWLWSALIGLAITPAFFGYASTNHWGALLGHLAVTFVAVLGLELARRLGKRFGATLRAETASLTVLQVIGWIVVTIQLFAIPEADLGTRLLISAGVLAALALMAALSSRYAIPRFWSILVGALPTIAAGAAILALPVAREEWGLALLPSAAGAMLVLLAGVAAALPTGALSSIHRLQVVKGAWAFAIVAAMPAGIWAAVGVLLPVDPGYWSATGVAAGIAVSLGLAALAIGTALMSFIVRRIIGSTMHVPALSASLWFGVYALGSVLVWQSFGYPVRVWLALGFAVALSALLLFLRWLRGASMTRRLPLILGAHLFVLYAAVISWTDDVLTILGGITVALAILLLSRLVMGGARPVYVALAYAYALVIFAHGLALAGVHGPAELSLTVTLAALCAIAATLVRPLEARSWYAILIVTALPFISSVALLLGDRTIWTALSTALVFALAFTLVVSRRPGLSAVLRGIAAALLVPSLAVITISLSIGEHRSGSPIALPIIAGIVAVTLPLTGLIGRALLRHGLSDRDARFVRLAIEGSALLTGAIAVIIALARIAAGLDIAFFVLAIIGVGSVATTLITGRGYARVVAFISFTGALWCFLGLQDVGVPEPYILPPALAGAIIGALGVALGRLRGRWYYWVGLGIATVSTLGLLAIRGNGEDAVFPWRTAGLLAFAVVLIAIGALVGRFPRVAALRLPSLVVAMVAAAAGMVQGIRFGWEWDLTTFRSQYLIIGALLFALGAALLAVAAGWLLQRGGATGRWLYLPAGVYLVLGPIASVRHAWFPIWTLAILALLLLLFLVLTTVLSRTRSISLPPVWFTFALAWITAVASWSQRELYVETYSIPMALALLAAGIIAMRSSSLPASFNSWPIGFAGSWRLLAPGVIVLFLASVLSTGTNPATWRAVLVIGMALLAIILGSRLRLAAPFIIGLIVLPIENIVIFAVQAGGHIEASTWWITLASAGAVLLGIAVTSERRSAGSEGGVAARIRDLK